MGKWSPQVLHEVQGGGVSPKQVWAPTWTFNHNYQEYGSPVELGTSDPGSANYTWTIDSGDFPQVNSDSGNWATNAQTNGQMILTAFMQFWGKNDNASGQTVTIKRYHKYGGGVTEETSSSGQASSTLPTGNYWRVAVTWNVGTTPRTQARRIVVDDVVGVRIWASSTSVMLYHRCMVLIPGVHWPHGQNVALQDARFLGTPNTTSILSDYGLGAGWGDSYSSSTLTMYAPLAQMNAGVATTSQYFPIYQGYDSYPFMSGSTSASGLTSAPQLNTSYNSSQSGVYQRIVYCLGTYTGARVRLNSVAD